MNKIGIILAASIVVTPLIIWGFMEPFSSRFATLDASLLSIGRLAGLSGLALISLNIFLANRFKWLDRIFFGLNQVYINHHLIGGLSLIMILIHPLALSVRLIPRSLEAAALLLIPRLEAPEILWGFLALIMFIFLLALTFFFRLPYQVWKFSHRFLGLAMLLASIHAFMITSDISRYPALKYYMLALVSGAIFSAVNRLFSRWLSRNNYQYRVKAITKLKDNFFEITMVPLGKNLHFIPGQFVFLSFDDKKFKESHPFSITSLPEDPELEVIFKILGDYTFKLAGLEPGTGVLVEGAFGRINFRNFVNKQVWIAGGIGLTPFLSMLKSLKADEGYDIALIYSAASEGQAIMMDELKELASQKSIEFYFWDSSRSGRLNAERIQHLVGEELSGQEILICGPSAMMSALKQGLHLSGVSKSRIHTEEFSLDAR